MGDMGPRGTERFTSVTPVVGIVGVGCGGAGQAVRIHRAQTDIELRARMGARARGPLIQGIAAAAGRRWRCEVRRRRPRNPEEEGGCGSRGRCGGDLSSGERRRTKQSEEMR